MKYFFLFLFCCGCPVHGDLGEQVVNGAMAGPFRDGLAKNWTKNCYGENSAEFEEEAADVHGGASAQRVTCTRFVTGGVQFRAGGIAVEKGKAYTLLVWMKGTCTSPVYVGVRKHGAPYTRYLRRYVRVRNEWRPYLIRGESAGTDPDCGIYLMFASEGTLLVDDVSLTPGIRDDVFQRIQRPAEKGNRVTNSGFEAGPEGWAPTDGFTLVSQGAFAGRRSARVERGTFECRPFHVRTGQRYSLSLYLKAERPRTRVRLGLIEWADVGRDRATNRDMISASVMVSVNWKRYHLSGYAAPNLWEDYLAQISPSGPVLVDNVQVEEGTASPYFPAHPLEVGTECSTLWCRVGQQVKVTAHVARAGSSPEPVSLRFTLEDLWSRPLETCDRTCRPGIPDAVTFQPQTTGMFRVRVQARDSAAAGEVCFGVFPERDREPRPKSLFGIHVAATATEPTNTFLASTAMGARWIRLHDFGDFCHWRAVEPQKGNFVWHDAEIRMLKSQGFTILANLGHPPPWAGREDPDRLVYSNWTNAPPRAMAEWKNYVERTVRHYRSSIHHWEIWNEPYGKVFFQGTPEDYVRLLESAYRTIKRMDSDAVVVGGCFSPGAEQWTTRILELGGLEFMDALSYHNYWGPRQADAPTPGQTPLLARYITRFRELMREHGRTKPIYMTEGGVRCPPFATWLPKEGFEWDGIQAASALVKGMAEMLSAGVSNICYYYTGGRKGANPWFSSMANGYYVLMDYAGRPKPTMMAFSALEKELDGAGPVKVFRSPQATAHLFQKGENRIAVVWARKRERLEVPGTELLDMMGNVMKTTILRPGEPVFIRAEGKAGAELEHRLEEESLWRR